MQEKLVKAAYNQGVEAGQFARTYPYPPDMDIINFHWMQGVINGKKRLGG
jgi:hypothetical protein